MVSASELLDLGLLHLQVQESRVQIDELVLAIVRGLDDRASLASEVDIRPYPSSSTNSITRSTVIVAMFIPSV